jgi:branched-chain amino acid transport system substrate-binding protein
MGRQQNMSKVSDWLEPLSEMVMPMLEIGARAYAEKNAPWPKRSEQCDAKS